MRFLVFFFAVFIGVGFSANAQRSDSIAAVVNGDIITYTDVYDRLDMILKSSQMPNTNDFKKKILPQILTGLITESVQLQEAEKLGHQVSEEEVNEGFSKIAEQNNFTADQFKTILRRQNVRVETLERQIRAQLAWGKVIQSEVRPRVTVGDSEINREIDQLKQKQGQEEYFIAEIYLPFTENDGENKVQAAANDLAKQLSRDVKSFPAAARQFSQSSTAANGGIVGWVTLDQLDPALADTLQAMNLQSVSQPIKAADGYSILYLREKRKIDLNNTTSQQIFRIKTAVFPLTNDQAARDAQLQSAQRFAKEVTGCLDIVKRTANQRDVRLDNISGPAGDITPDIFASVENLSVGDAGALVTRPNEIIVPMLCGREGGQGGTAALEHEIEQRIGLQRIDTLQKRLLRDLVSNAYIERRV